MIKVKFWYESSTSARFKALLLMPISLLFWLVSAFRKKLYVSGILPRYRAPVPVIVVGNINVGGTGKTPTVIAVVEYLKQQGFSPAVVSRGYGGKASSYPYILNSNSSSQDSGDEPLLIHQRCRVPVAVDPVRSQAIKALLESDNIDVIVCDDGLQHYAMHRDIEIVVQDQTRLLGNRRLLPAGPLRETAHRLRTVDFVIFNGANENELSRKEHHHSYSMQLLAGRWSRVRSLTPISQPLTTAIESLNTPIAAMAGIGNPQRFYQTLEEQGISIEHYIELGDHKSLSKAQIEKYTGYCLLMTEKDAMKYPDYAGENWYYLPVEAQISTEFFLQLSQKLALAIDACNRKG